MNNQGNYLLSLLIGTILLIMIFANFVIVWAENSSPIISKKSHQFEFKSLSSENLEFIKEKKIINNALRPTEKVELKTMDKTSLDNSLSNNDIIKYDVKIGRIKESKAPNQFGTKTLKLSGDMEVKPISPSNQADVRLRTTTQMGPVKAICADSMQQKSLDNRTVISGEIEIRPIKNFPEQRNGSSYNAKDGPIKALEIPIKERLKVSEIRASRLDESGTKTDKESTIRVIKRITQPSSNLNK